MNTPSSSPGRGKRIAALATAIFGGWGAVEAFTPPTPEVQPRVELVDSELNRALTCARERFNDIAFYSPLGASSWAVENCPGHKAAIEQLRELKYPLSLVRIAETRREILAQAGVSPNLEQWLAPDDPRDPKLTILIDEKAEKAAREAGKIK